MFYADEVRDFASIDLEDTAVRDKEVQLAEMLINELTEEKFNPMAFKDEYRERLLERIREKARGKTIIAEEREEEERGGAVVDIMEALRRSLEKGRGAAPARARRAPKRAAAASKKSRAEGSKKRKAS
jgi:DNA end-binding protein Ku